ncbi:hypothetical protein QT711_03100 [Sporosarcina saromensis]|uniref:Minor capsid protein n=1 Tax=Sporosarcina saromensis TaxID=359365 RepID=A0ABU4G716_9BACL|nr:hypothetical protein [Sporosarcina saromensis]MDW0112157.1 hypothetical protein [Sporosarcina saromensis]
MILIPSVELQKAIIKTLSPHHKVVSVKSDDVTFPFVEIGSEIERDGGTKTHNRSYHHLTIHTWTKSNSPLDSKTLNHSVKHKIMNLQTVEGFYLDFVKLSSVMTMTETEADTTIWHGILQFEIEMTKKEG